MSPAQITSSISETSAPSILADDDMRRIEQALLAALLDDRKGAGHRHAIDALLREPSFAGLAQLQELIAQAVARATE
jgi:hypothetical protein